MGNFRNCSEKALKPLEQLSSGVYNKTFRKCTTSIQENIRGEIRLKTYSLVTSPLGPVGVASLGSMPWVSRMCLAAGLRRNLGKEEHIAHLKD